MESELKSMQIMIGGRSYPLKVKEEDQEAIKKIADDMNEKINDFQLTYINKDKQDCLAMTLLTYAVENHKIKNSESSSDKLGERIDRLHSMLDGALK